MGIGIKQIAEMAGVAQSTVSHVLNGTAPISQEVQEKVLDAAKDTGYLDKRMRRASVSLLTTVLTVASEVTLPKSDRNFVAWNMLNAFRRECRSRGIRVVPHIEQSETIDPGNVISSIKKHNPRGVAVIQDERDELISVLGELDIGTVILSGHDPLMRVNTVAPGNRFWAQIAMRHRVDLGHKDIEHITWSGRHVAQQRSFGFSDALLQEVLAQSRESIIDTGSYHPETVEKYMDEWLSKVGRPLPFTAFFCGADNVAVGLLRSLQKAGLRVPEDVSVVGFDDAPFSEMEDPALTTVHIPMDEIGRVALNLLEDAAITPRSARIPKRVDLGCELIVRRSTAPPRRRSEVKKNEHATHCARRF